MADPITIIGVASSIITFIDVGFKTLRLIHDAGNGPLPEVEAFELILKEINMRCADINQNGSGAKNISGYETIIIDQAKECRQIATKLSNILETLRKRRNTMFENSRVAVNYMRKRREIDGLNNNLKLVYDRMILNVGLVLQKENNSLIMSELNELKEFRNKHNIPCDNDLGHLQMEILGLTTKSDTGTGHQDAEPSESERNEFRDRLISFQEMANEERQQFNIIRSLHFDYISRRWSQIPDAERHTNNWLFDQTEIDFINWLESKNGIYWIQGKAGSGKSTLMKFAAEHPNTKRALEQWALPAEACNPSFYFWNQGFEMQRSQRGLLQSILYQILRKNPSIATQVCPKRSSYEEWHIKELKATLELVLKQDNLRTKFCFFIDGLDEYGGGEEELVNILEFFVSNPNVKLCVSSRPRMVLDERFQQRRHTLIIHDFTAKDMKMYVRQNLEKNAKFKKLQQSSSSVCDEIIEKISSQAKGVWLWVYLVTRSLIVEVNRDEGVSTLRKVLNKFPKDLESYFTAIIEDIRPGHRQEMAQIFLITIAEVQPLPLFVFSLLEKERNNIKYATESCISPLSPETVETVEKDWTARIHNRCGDLVTVGYEDHPVFLRHPVDYLHRTVGDFLQDCYYEKLETLAPDFNPYVSLCKMMLFLLKGLPGISIRDKKSITTMIAIVDELLYYAREVEKRDQQTESVLVDVLDEVDRVNIHHLSSINNHWTHIRDPPTTRGYDEYREGGNCNFLALAVQARLVKYVREKLRASPMQLKNKRGRPLLDYALRPRRVTPLAMPYHSERDDPPVDLDMVKLLLKHGSHPNQKVHLNDGRTVWELFLVSCDEATRRNEASLSTKDAWYQASEILINHGASPTYSFSIGTNSLSIPAILERVFGKDEASKLQQLPQGSRQLPSEKGWISWLSLNRLFAK